MELRQLNALVGIADHGSFSAAADAMHTVQSNVSAHVKKLERELGCELVERATGQLTEAGEIVVARSRRMQAELDAMLSDVVALTREVSGTVRIGIIGTTARWLIPQLLRATPVQYPHLRLVFVESPNTRLDTQLATGQVDVAVLDLPTEGVELKVTPLFEEDLVLVVRRDNPLAVRRELSLAELEGVPLLLPLAGTALRCRYRRRHQLQREPPSSPGPRSTAPGSSPRSPSRAGALRSCRRRRCRATCSSDFALVKLTEIPRRLVGVVQRAHGPAFGSCASGARSLDRDRLRPGQDSPGAHPGPLAKAAPRWLRRAHGSRPALSTGRRARAT